MPMQDQFDRLLRKATAEKFGLGSLLEDIEKIKPLIEKINLMQDTLKGADGKTPERGKDYLTEEEMQQITQQMTPQKGVHYNDGAEGIPGRDGFTPIKGVDYLNDEELNDIRKKSTPKKGKHYFTPAEIDEFKAAVTPQKGKDYRDGKDGMNISTTDFLAYLKGMNDKDRAAFSKEFGGLIDISHVRNASSFIFNGKKYGTHELMHGGGSSSSGGGFTKLTTTVVPNGIRTAFTFTTATAQPSYLVSDGVWYEAIDSTLAVNWTWSGTTATLLIPAPIRAVFAVV